MKNFIKTVIALLLAGGLSYLMFYCITEGITIYTLLTQDGNGFSKAIFSGGILVVGIIVAHIYQWLIKVLSMTMIVGNIGNLIYGLVYIVSSIVLALHSLIIPWRIIHNVGYEFDVYTIGCCLISGGCLTYPFVKECYTFIRVYSNCI